MNKNDFSAIQYEQSIGPYTEKMVAVFREKSISEQDVKTAIETGRVEENKDILVTSEEKWVRIFRYGNPFPTDDKEKIKENQKEEDDTMSNKQEFDAVLVQCAIDTAPTIADYKKAMELLKNADGEQTRLEPIQYGENNTFAGGFITESASEKIDYFIRQHDPFGLKIRDILSDKNKETEDGVYTIEGLRVAILYADADNS